jgi:hypothetical protein
VATPRSAFLAALLFAAPSLADERFDHRGAVGLLLDGVFQSDSAIVFHQGSTDLGARWGGEIGGTYAVGYNGNELMLTGFLLAPAPGESGVDWGMTTGYRGYFGQGRLKSYLQIQAAAHFRPVFSFGPRLGLGFQYEVTPIVGVWGGIGGEIGVGPSELRLVFLGNLGLQFRSYLLE